MNTIQIYALTALTGTKSVPSYLTGTEVVEAEEADNVVQAPMANRPNSQLQVYNIPQYPKPYFRGTNGGVYAYIWGRWDSG